MASPGDQPPRAESGIELTTLVISALASAAAAYVTSKIWAPGTLFSAAMSPVIVALVKEGLRKPTEVVANVVPTVVPSPARWTRGGASEPGLVVDPDPARIDPDPLRAEAGAAAAQPSASQPEAPHVLLPPVAGGESGPVRVHSTRARRLRWRLALVTGILGFAICAVIYTVPELVTGRSISGHKHSTTLFSHRKSKKPRLTRPTVLPTRKPTTATSTTSTSATETTRTVTTTKTVTAPTTTTTTSTTVPTTATTTPTTITETPATATDPAPTSTAP
jgi:hypothetical protein